MIWFGLISGMVILAVVSFIITMNRLGEKLEGDEEATPMIWADEEWYKEDGPPDGS